MEFRCNLLLISKFSETFLVKEPELFLTSSKKTKDFGEISRIKPLTSTVKQYTSNLIVYESRKYYFKQQSSADYFTDKSVGSHDAVKREVRMGAHLPITRSRSEPRDIMLILLLM